MGERQKHSSVDGDHGRIETRSSLIQRDRSRVSLRSKFHLAAWKNDFLAELPFANLKRRHKCKMQIKFVSFGY
jgi:hypothetical protein